VTLTRGDVNREIGERLSAHNIRFTKGRRQVIRVLRKASGPQSAADLHRQLRTSVPLSSIYRSLAVLDEAGVLRKHHDQSGLARFELAEWLSGHHHHVTCFECGRVEDVELDDKAEKKLTDIARLVGRRTRHQVTGHGLEIEGVCDTCRS
jgi:Fur family ferric uptake transcriptional regulator